MLIPMSPGGLIVSGGGPPTTPWDSGWRFPVTTGTVVFSGSTGLLSNSHLNLKADDAIYARSNTLNYGNFTAYYWGYNYGFVLPAGAVPVGVEMRFEAMSSVASNHGAKNIFLSQGSSNIGTNRASDVPNWSNTPVVRTVGGSGDMWGTSLGKDDIEASNFGCLLSILNVAVAAAEARVDYMQMRVHCLIP